MQPIKLPTLGYFKNGNGWLGSAGPLRFQIEPPAEEQISVVFWQGPFSRPYAQELGRETFSLDETGLAALVDFLTAQSQALTDHPAFTSAETTAFYQAKRAEESAPAAED